MSGNTLGTLFTVTSFGESHGPAIGCVVDGCPPGIELCEAEIQAQLDRRKPGTSRHVTQRREPDTVEILSGVFEGKTTGTPIGLLIRNEAGITAISPKVFVRDMPTTPTRRNTGFAIIVAAAVRPRAKQRCAWRPGRSPGNG